MSTPEDATVVVMGGTAGGIATAVRTAREGIDTRLITIQDHLGGALPSLGGLDSFYEGNRAPILQSFLDAVDEYYRETSGPESDDYALATGRTVPHLRCFEPHVAETILEELVAVEDAVSVTRGYVVDTVDRDTERIRSLTVRSLDTGDRRTVAADFFVDATYEGDLLANAGVPYRVGRESRSEFGEQHAGKIFTAGGTEGGSEGVGEYRRDAAAGDLNLKIWGEVSKEILTDSTGEGDDAVQAYNFRLCMTSNEDNQVPIEKPDGYDRDRYVGILEDPVDAIEGGHPLHSRFLNHPPEELSFPYSGPWLPNEKAGMNAANLVGEVDDYPDGDWERRQEIITAHREHALGLMYFLQTDPAVPAHVQAEANEWALAADEFEANDHVPRQLYIREARRMDGQYVVTEDDMRVASGIDRPPIFEDSIATAGDWYMDSHSCTTDRVRGSMGDGKILLTEVTRPCQLPFRTLVPPDLENLIVPVALSASHVAWGGIRLEPTWLHIGEAAGHAVAAAVEYQISLSAVSIDRLQRRLIEHGVMISWFNDVDMGMAEPWVPAIQYLGTKGFFRGFDAAPEAPLTSAVGDVWARATAERLVGIGDARKTVRALPADACAGKPITGPAFRERLTHEFRVRGLDTEDISVLPSDCSRGRAASEAYALLAG